jgi:predicted transcriptional regulator
MHMAASRVSARVHLGIPIFILPHIHRPQSMTFTQITTAAAKKGIAISRLADMAGVARSTVSRAKKGEFDIKPVTLAKPAQALKGAK